MSQSLRISNAIYGWKYWKIVYLALVVLNMTSIYPVLAQAQTSQELSLRTLTVTGRAVETVSTTLTQVQLGVEVQGKTAAEVQQEAARRSSAVVDLLRSRNVEKLQTTGIRLNPNYTYQNNVQRLIGYTATNTVTFRIQTERVGNLLDEAVQSGATRIDGISFVAADSTLATAQQQALREAVQDAQRQADAVLSALNLTRQEVISIQVNGAAPPQPLLLRTEVLTRGGLDATPSTPVIGGEQQVEASVTLQIRY